MWRLIFLCLLLPVISAGQDTLLLSRSVDVNYENDVMDQQDRYYSQGIRIGYTFPVQRRRPFTRLFVRLPGSRDEYFGVYFNQQCFTPTSVREDAVLRGDRPFAGLSFAGFTRSSLLAARRMRLRAELDVGGIGSCAACEQTHKFIHSLFRNDEPYGWHYQVRNALLLDYSVALEKGLITSPLFDVTAFGSARAGTVFTNAGAGLVARIGWMDPYFMPPGYSKRFRVWMTGQAAVYGVAYNGTLQGALLSRDCIYTIPAADVHRVVGRVSGGIAAGWGRVRLEYTKVHITQEFRGGFSHGWGHCRVVVLF